MQKLIAATIALTAASAVGFMGPSAADEPVPKVEKKAAPARLEKTVGIKVKDAASAALAAHNDMTLNVAPIDRPYTRYMTIYAVHPKDRDRYVRVLNFWVNSLSRNGQIYLMTRVVGTDDALLRCDIRDYQWSPKLWDKVVEQDRYFIAKLVRTRKIADVKTVEEPEYTIKKENVLVSNGMGGYVQQVRETKVATGRTIKTEVTTGVRDEQTKVLAVGPWIEPAVAATLIEMSQSSFPVIKGELFFDATSADDVYKQFVGFDDTEAGFQKIADGDPDAVAKLQSDRQGTVTFSGVTLRNRRLTRLPTRSGLLGGYYWYSTDTRDDVGAKNYLEVLLERGPSNFDASEQIFSLPNGLQGYGLFNNKGQRQPEAPPDIAGDKSSTSNDLRVRSPVSCVRCHAEGIIKFKSAFTDLRKSIRIDAYKKDDLYRLDQLYGADIVDTFDHDQEAYARAVKKASGMTAKENAAEYARVYHDWDEAPVTVETAAADLGITIDECKKVLRRSERNTILALVADDPVPIRRTQWVALFPEAAVLLLNSRVAAGGKMIDVPVADPPAPKRVLSDHDKAFPRFEPPKKDGKDGKEVP